MTEVQERDQALHDLYHNRQFWVFLNGEAWFDKQIYDIHRDWLQGGTWLEITDDDVTIAVVSWAADYGYLETA